jgi:cyclopropane fatty-acyl-phospholipid synthase-like methyltransferase
VPQDLVTLLFCDYRDTPATLGAASFDVVVSVEMIEAVGHEHLQPYFRTIGTMLKPGGRAVLQGICCADERWGCGGVGWRRSLYDPRAWCLKYCALKLTYSVVTKAHTLVQPALLHLKLFKPAARRYETYCHTSDFIREHVFPGGHLPSLGAIVDACRGTGMALRDTHDIGGWGARRLLRPCLSGRVVCACCAAAATAADGGALAAPGRI